MKQEIAEFFRDRLIRITNTAYIGLPIIFSVLSTIQDKPQLLRLGLFLFFLTILVSNSIHILVAQKTKPGFIVDRQGNRAEVPVTKYPRLRTSAFGGLSISVIILLSAAFVPGLRASLSVVSTPTSTVTPSPTVTLVPPTASPTPTTAAATATFTATSTSTLTATPSSTPTVEPTATINPMVFRGLDQSCFRKNQNIWSVFYYDREVPKVDSRNCWDLAEWGVFAETGNIRFSVTDELLGQDITRKLHTKIKGDAEIRFSLKISQFTSNSDFDGQFILGVGDISTMKEAGLYLMYVLPGSGNDTYRQTNIYREIGPGTEYYYTGTRSIYPLEEVQNITFKVEESKVRISSNGYVIQDYVRLPENDLAFWFLYTLPAKEGSLIATISGFQIYDHR